MTPDIIRKLAAELDAGISSEAQVVYLLTGIRKLIERDEIQEQFAALKFHCDWALHSKMDRAAAKAILKQFDAAHILLRGNIKLQALPASLRTEIDRISKMEPFEEQLSQFLAAYGLPPLTKHRSDGWTHFLHLYAKVVEDIPLVVSSPADRKKPTYSKIDHAPKHISHVVVHLESARKTLKHALGEDAVFKVVWTIHDKNGQPGNISIFNSFELSRKGIESERQSETMARAAKRPSTSMKLEVAQVVSFVQKLEGFIDESEFIPATAAYRGTVVLSLLSKSLTVSRGVCALVDSGVSEEAFGLTRTLMDIYFTVRYISNQKTESRSERFAKFFAKNHESWTAILPKYFPTVVIPDGELHRFSLEAAKNYKSPHDWSGVQDKTRGLALEPDAYEFDATGKPTTAEFDYEVLFKWTSHFVHATVSSLESHLAERGDIFRVRARNQFSVRYADNALFNVLAFLSKIFVCAFRALNQDQPETILQEMHQHMASYADERAALHQAR